MRDVWLLSAALLFTITPSLSCPNGFYRMPVVNCPTTRCYRFQEQAEVFQQNRQEKQAFCSGQAANIYDGTGGLIQFRSIEEFNRVKLILGVTQPSAPYLTSLRYSSTGTLEYATGSSESVGSTISSNMPLTTSNSSLFGMCVGIGLVGSSINLMVVNCDKPQIFICDLQLTSVPVPTLAGDNIRYVGPDLSLTLSCQFAVSNAIRGVIWLRNGQDITTQFTAGYSITPNPTSVSDLVFTAFDRSNYVGSYQCMVVGQLGSLRSKRVLVRSAVAPQIRHGPMDTAFPPGSIGFFSCFPKTSSLPHPSVVWSKDGTVMDISDGTKFRVNARTGRLFISDVAASDAGVYSCQLTNIEATVTSQGASLTLNNTADLTPLYRLTPDFDIGSDPIRVLEGTQLEMDVVAGSSHPNANYLWSYPSGIAPPGGVAPRSSITLGYRNRPGTTVQASYFGNLILNSAMVANSGLFSVLVSLIALPITGGEENAYTNGEASVIVQSVPTASFPTTAEIVSLGASLQLNCTVDSNPTPTVEWFRNGILLQNDADYELSGSNLTIRSVQTRDLTSFQCLAGNEVGSAVDELYLCGRNGVPDLVEINVEPFTTTSVRIRWDPPTNPNDDIELLSYEVYYEQRGINGPRMFDVTGLAPQDTRTWNQREVLVEQLDVTDAVVAVVVAVSPQGRGVVPTGDQAAVGFTFRQGTLSPSGSVSIDCGGQQTFTCTLAASGPAAWTITGLQGISAAGTNGVLVANNNARVTSAETTPGAATSTITITGFTTADSGGTVQCTDQFAAVREGSATVAVAACELANSDPISTPTTAAAICILSGVIPSVVLILINIISVAVAVLVTRHCYMKSGKGGSSSRREELYEQAEVHEDINMTDSPAYGPASHAPAVYIS